ncbi:MAG TPA: hypothetical protein VEU96_20750 [Bryobacteraceae bacterium]|nr:hypothetical protein [Bryobacteraceae bacterium]
MFLLFVLVANALSAASPNITVQVSSETAPPGGYAQFKISLTSPTLVSSASISMNFDPVVFGNVSTAAIAAFSATGDQTGYALVQGQQITAYFTSASAGIGQLPQLPVFVVTVPVLATAKIGATSSVTVDPTQQTWQDPQGNPYSISVNPGTFTVGGTLSIQSVTPGGGLLPSGTVVSIDGTGFDATATATIDGVSLSSPHLVGTRRIEMTLGGATEMTGKRVHITNATGASVDYFAALPALAAARDNFLLILPSLPFPQYTAVTWDYSVASPRRRVYSCLQNPGATPITATYYVADSGGVTVQNVVIPPYSLYIADNTTLATRFGTLAMTVPAPIRMAECVLQINSINGSVPDSVTVSPPQQMTALGSLGVRELSSVVWNWQLGTPAPQPQTQYVSSGFPFTVSISANAKEWLQVTPTTGGSGFTFLTVTPVVSNLGAGTYSGTITITPQLPAGLAQVGTGAVSFLATINASAQPALINPGTLSFDAAGGTAPAPKTLPLTSNGTPAAFTANIVPVSGGNWLSVTPSSGTTPTSLTLMVNPVGLTVGFYQSILSVHGPINTIDVYVQLSIPGLDVFPTSLAFSLKAGESAPSQPQFLTVETGSSSPLVMVSATTQSGGNWLNAAQPRGTEVQVNAIAINLGPGTYQGSVTITDPASSRVATVPVTLTVGPPAGPSQLAVAPSSLTLNAAAGTIATANLSVSSISGPGYFTLAALPEPFRFVVTPASSGPQYRAPAMVQVSANASLPGTYHESVTIGWDGGSAVIPLTYYATASPSTPPVITAVVGSGSAIPGSIAPGELLSIFGSGLGAAPVGLQLASNGTVAATLGGTQVLINGTAAPLIYASTGQVNAIMPYEIDTNGVATIQVVAGGTPSASWAVPLAPSAPSIFTLDGSGVGQGAIVNADSSINGASNPAFRGSMIQIYATGGGQTSPPSVTGGVAQTTANLTLPVSVTIGGVKAQTLYAGSAPGEVEGVVQINAVVPPGVTPGVALPVLVTIGGVAAQTGVTVAIQ